MNKSNPLIFLAVGCGALVALGTAGGVLFMAQRRSAVAEVRAMEAARAAAMEAERRSATLEREKLSLQESAARRPANDENEVLRQKIAELERTLQAAQTRIAELEAAQAALPAEKEAPELSLEERKAKIEKQLAALAEQGMFAMNTEPFNDLVKDLRTLGPEGAALLGKMLLEGKATGERFFAGAVMEALSDPASVPFLVQSLQQEKDTLVRRMSSHALAVGKFAEGRDALDQAMMTDNDWGVRVNSAYGLAKMGDGRGVREMVKWYEAPETEAQYKIAILGGIADVGDPSTVPLFRTILQESKDIGVLTLAISGAGKTKDFTLLQDLQRVADSTPDGTVREAAEKAIKAIRGH